MQLRVLALALGLAFAAGAQAGQPTLSLEAIGQHQTGVFDQGAAEIVGNEISGTTTVFQINLD